VLTVSQKVDDCKPLLAGQLDSRQHQVDLLVQDKAGTDFIHFSDTL